MTMLKRILMNAAKDPKAGGAGDDKPDPPDLESLVATAVAAALPKVMHGAITAHLKRLEAKFEDRFSKIEKPTEEEDADPGAGAGDDAGAKKPAGGGGGKLTPELEARIRAAEKRAEKAEKIAADEKAARETAEATARAREERSALHEALAAAGVPKERLRGATALLYTEDKRVKRTDDGKIHFVVADDDEKPIAEGVAAWLKTPEGLQYAPPRNAGGSGATRTGGAGGSVGAGDVMSDSAFVGVFGGGGRTE